MKLIKKNKVKNENLSQKQKPILLIDFDIDRFLLNREARQHKNRS